MAASVLAVGFGVAAGYLDGWADDLPSMLANIFPVLPTLLIVIFGQLGNHLIEVTVTHSAQGQADSEEQSN